MKSLHINNFRDISGYCNCDGQMMKAHKIYRGAALNLISQEEASYLENDLGIRYIIDFRDEKESKMTPDYSFKQAVYQRISALQIKKHASQGFDFGTMLQGQMTKEKYEFLLEYVKEGYQTMAFDNPAYHYLFGVMLKNEGNIYFHCSAGKDRTGVAGFLIMIALGMSEEDAIKEYLLSNVFLRESNEALCNQLQIPVELRKECEPLLYVQKEFIDLTIQSIKNKYDSYDEFLLKEYYLDKEKREKLKEIYCE